MWFIYSNWHFHRYLSPTLPRWTWSSSRRSGPLFPNKAMILIVDYISFTSWKWSSCLVMCFQILTHSTIWIRNGSQRKRFNKNPHKILLHYIVYVMIYVIDKVNKKRCLLAQLFRGRADFQRSLGAAEVYMFILLWWLIHQTQVVWPSLDLPQGRGATLEDGNGDK